MHRCTFRRTAPDRQGRRQQLQHEDVLTKKVRTLERKLVKEQREKMRVQATRARDAIERAEMEEFFMRCVEVRAVSYIMSPAGYPRMHTMCSLLFNCKKFVECVACVNHMPPYRTSGEKLSRGKYGNDRIDR